MDKKIIKKLKWDLFISRIEKRFLGWVFNVYSDNSFYIEPDELHRVLDDFLEVKSRVARLEKLLHLK